MMFWALFVAQYWHVTKKKRTQWKWALPKLFMLNAFHVHANWSCGSQTLWKNWNEIPLIFMNHFHITMPMFSNTLWKLKSLPHFLPKKGGHSGLLVRLFPAYWKFSRVIIFMFIKRFSSFFHHDLIMNFWECPEKLNQIHAHAQKRDSIIKM